MEQQVTGMVAKADAAETQLVHQILPISILTLQNSTAVSMTLQPHCIEV